MEYQFLLPWHCFLPRGGGHLVSVFGGGGKTSLLKSWAALYRREKVPVAVTTTTRSEPLDWPDLAVREWRDVTEGTPLSSDELVFVRRGKYTDGKWRGLTGSQADHLVETWANRVVLVEADGSGGMPVKLHLPGEPVWPQRTSLAVAVVGLGAIGQAVGSVLQRHGTLTPPWPSTMSGKDVFGWDHLWALLTARGGYLNRVPAGVPTVLVLTQIAALADSLGLFDFLGRIMGEGGMPLVVLCELGTEEPKFHTVFRVPPGATVSPGDPNSPTPATSRASPVVPNDAAET